MRGRSAIPIELRFHRHVQKRADGCWIWTSTRFRGGYGGVCVGLLRNGTKKLARAHRIAWELRHGQIPQGMCVLHRCDNPPCVNPDHLFLGTHRDNIDDMIAKGRHVGGRRHGNGLCGESNPYAKLTREKVAWIRRVVGRISPEDLGWLLGVAGSTVRTIARGKTWRQTA